jgi:tRNA-uridine 2-sulfurtransferase
MSKKTVVLAMSGGVDSSVAAYLLKKKGYIVIGLTFKLWQHHECESQGSQSCCSADSIEDAKQACVKFGIPHYVIDCAKKFKAEVIGRFLNDYKKGLTPNPCIVCNEKIKFPILIEHANALRADYIATGHYAVCCYSMRSRRFVVKEAKDKSKDQSYVLFSLTQDILSRLKLPVGKYKKDVIRSIAKRIKLNSCKRQESQEICFVRDNDLKRFLRENIGSSIKKGIIKDANGRLLASHEGTCFFTIGQRRGLRVPYGSPIYVTDKDCETGDITVGNYRDTLKKSILTKSVNWIMPVKDLKKMGNIKVKIRYKHQKAAAKAETAGNKNVRIIFKDPQSAPTPGQAAVFYRNDTVIGGGWII